MSRDDGFAVMDVSTELEVVRSELTRLRSAEHGNDAGGWAELAGRYRALVECALEAAQADLDRVTQEVAEATVTVAIGQMPEPMRSAVVRVLIGSVVSPERIAEWFHEASPHVWGWTVEKIATQLSAFLLEQEAFALREYPR